MTTLPQFARRRNRDSSVDSICTRCIQTISTAAREEELAIHEEKCCCDPYGEFSPLYFNSDLRAHRVRHPYAERAD